MDRESYLKHTDMPALFEEEDDRSEMPWDYGKHFD